jgi:dTDP-4-dehydrorhamnose 3,5-epimerase
MVVKDTKLEGVKLIINAPFEDFRGMYREIYNEKYYESFSNVKFIQDDISTSRKNVLKGIHGDEITWKLVSCLYGAFYLVVVNNNKESFQYRQWESFTLSDKNNLQILIPAKFGNGHLILTDEAIFHYKQSTYYGEYEQFTIKWNDPELNINWPINNPILSDRDK